MKYYFAFILSFFVAPAVFCAENNWAWVQSSKGKNTNSIVGDEMSNIDE